MGNIKIVKLENSKIVCSIKYLTSMVFVVTLREYRNKSLLSFCLFDSIGKNTYLHMKISAAW